MGIFDRLIDKLTEDSYEKEATYKSKEVASVLDKKTGQYKEVDFNDHA